MEYERDPARIFAQSMATLEAMQVFNDLPSELRAIGRRMVHASGVPEIAPLIRWQGDPHKSAREAIRQGANILCDTEMVAQGVLRPPLVARAQEAKSATVSEVRCFLNDPRSVALGKEQQITRSAAGVSLWQPHLAGAVVVIGNAPTALFRLLEGLLEEGWARPAVIFALPVGFIGAAESKEALLQSAAQLDAVAFVTLVGRQGGSAMAAAAVNATSAEATASTTKE